MSEYAVTVAKATKKRNPVLRGDRPSKKSRSVGIFVFNSFSFLSGGKNASQKTQQCILSSFQKFSAKLSSTLTKNS